MKYKILVVFVLLIFVPVDQVLAISPQDLQSIQSNTIYYINSQSSPGISSCGSTGTLTVFPLLTSPAGSTTGSWKSTATPPYYLEEFAINVLEYVAQKDGVSENSAVTRQHVLALVAWFYAEGGDINNSNLFNPLNTSLQDSALETTKGPGGNEAFNSFNSGVEGTALTIMGSNQNRIAAVLMNPSTSASTVLATVANYQIYPGNQAWASPGGSPTQPEVIAFNQNTYLPLLYTVLQEVKANYSHYATIEMGLNKHTALKGHYVPASELQYNTTGSVGQQGNGSASNSSTCSAGPWGSRIAQTALSFSWPEPPEDVIPPRNSFLATSAYSSYITNYDSGAPYKGADCGAFVGAVMRSSGADPNYPVSGTSEQQQYVENHPNLYTILYNVNSTKDLQVGDIAIVNLGSGNGADGHTYIYVGPQPGGYNEASASMNQRMPSLGQAIFQDYRGHYIFARLIKPVS